MTVFQAGFPQVLFLIYMGSNNNIRQKVCEQAEMRRGAAERGTRVCVYPFMKMGNPEANMLSSPLVQIIESECWKHALLFHAPRVNSLLGHLKWSSFESPHDISCLSLNHYFASPFSKFLLFRTEWWLFFPGKTHAGSPFTYYIHQEALQLSLRIFAAIFPGSVGRDWESWENH